MEDLARNPIYKNTQKWCETFWCNQFLPSSSSLPQHFLWNVPFQNRVSCLCYSNCCLIVSRMFPIVLQLHRNYCTDIAPCFREPLCQALSVCHCSHFKSCYHLRSGSSEAEAAYGLSSLRSLDVLACADLRFRTSHNCAPNLNQHWPQVAVWEHFIKQNYAPHSYMLLSWYYVDYIRFHFHTTCSYCPNSDAL